MSDSEPKLIGPYELQRKLGEGGMGSVYLGWHQVLEVQHAIKVLAKQLSDDASFVKRFMREARTAAKLKHPNIVQVLGADRHDGLYYMAMQYVRGEALSKQVRQGALPAHNAVRYIHQICHALSYAHGEQIVHRDIKPANILIDEHDNALLCDFGLVRDLAGGDVRLTVPGALVGTFHFMAPEQWQNREIDARTDLYALGVTLYHLLTRSFPFRGRTPSTTLSNLMQGTPFPISRLRDDLDWELVGLIHRAIQVSADQRYESAQEMGAALESWWMSHPPEEPLSLTPIQADAGLKPASAEAANDDQSTDSAVVALSLRGHPNKLAAEQAWAVAIPAYSDPNVRGVGEQDGNGLGSGEQTWRAPSDEPAGTRAIAPNDSRRVFAKSPGRPGSGAHALPSSGTQSLPPGNAARAIPQPGSGTASLPPSSGTSPLSPGSGSYPLPSQKKPTSLNPGQMDVPVGSPRIGSSRAKATIALRPSVTTVDDPLEVAPNTWWVGQRLGGVLENNSYLRLFEGNGQRLALLTDPGPPEDLQPLLTKLQTLIGGVKSLNILFMNHQDPDVSFNSGSLQKMNPSLYTVCSTDTWRLVRFYGLDAKRFRAAEKFPDNTLTLKTGHRLRFVPSPYCHFRGAVMLYDEETRVLFTGDLFGGLSFQANMYVDERHWKGVRAFHQIYMPSQRALQNAMDNIRALPSEVELIAPQHGSLIRGEWIQTYIDRLSKLEVGTDLFDAKSENDIYVAAMNEILADLVQFATPDEISMLLHCFEFDGQFPDLIQVDRNGVRSIVVDAPSAMEGFLQSLKENLDAEHHDRFQGIVTQVLASWNIPIPREMSTPSDDFDL